MSRSSRSSPLARRSRNSTVLWRRASSDSASISGSSALMSGTSPATALMRRPSPARRILSRTFTGVEPTGVGWGLPGQEAASADEDLGDPVDVPALEHADAQPLE